MLSKHRKFRKNGAKNSNFTEKAKLPANVFEKLVKNFFFQNSHIYLL